MNKNILQIGLFGFGTVGGGLAHVLDRGKTVNANIKTICIRNPEKERELPKERFTTNPDDILEDSEINLVVELIDDADAAYEIVKKALKEGKSVVSGNKRMLAYHLEELICLQEEYGVALLYEASACGSIPIIRNLEEYYDNDLLKSITGILNGSSNFILSKMFRDNLEYESALKIAQDLGFAESDPKFDVDGFDSLFKLVILAVHSLGIYVHPSKIFNYGISNIKSVDICYALEKRKKIKLIGQILKLDNNTFTLFVMPKLVGEDEYIYSVEDEYNGVVIEGECYDKQFMFGKGAGSYPTGSAVLSDITARMHDYCYEYKKMKYFNPLIYNDEISVEIYLRYVSLVDFSLFEFECINERYSDRSYCYVVGYIKLSNLFKIRTLLPNIDVFIAFTNNVK
ncbi:MAG: homoserine dehydrogenase [Bacteroidales bacterium]|jgi:homoserine dehydrogenase